MAAIAQKSVTGDPAASKVLSALAFALVALSFSSIFIKKLELESVAPPVIAFYRMAIATVLLAPWTLAFKRREIASLKKRDILMLVLGGFCLAVHFGAWITSLRYIPIATAVVLVNSHPLFVVIASSYLLGERPTRRMIAGTVAGLAGMLVMASEALLRFDATLLGDALAVLGALAVVGYFIVGRKVRARVSLFGYATPLYAICSLFLFIWLFAQGDRLHPYSRDAWVYLAALALVPTVLGHTIFNWALKHVPPSAVSVTFLGEPLVASALALLFFGERPPVSTLIGGAVVLAGIYLTTSSNGVHGTEEVA